MPRCSTVSRRTRFVAPALAACLVLGAAVSAHAEDASAGDAERAGQAERTGQAEQRRQHAFSAAAREFGVPEPVLLAVSFLQSRWDAHAGEPSTGAGYGPMHLTDIAHAGSGAHHDSGTEDPRGDLARPRLHPRAAHDTEPAPPALRTIERAARLTGTDVRTLRTDPAQNIRGGAALLAAYQRELGARGTHPADWYEAVARYSGARQPAAARVFADEVFGTLRAGESRRTDDGQWVRLPASPDLETPEAGRSSTRDDVECPASISCEWIPAPYEKLPDGGFGNHDKANRPDDQKVNHIVIHNTEETWDNTLKLVQDPAYVSWHYTLRSQDGHIAQHVKTKDVGWHAGNWYVNAKSIGLEHEGFARQGTWFTEAMYRTSAKLVRYLADRYDIPLDRAHIIGHDNVPGTTPDTVAGMHWDTGPYWDWEHYFELLGAPLRGNAAAGGGLVTITPDFATNRPAFTGCTAGKPARPCPKRGSSAVVLRTEPRPDAPLLTDIGLHPDGSPSTMDVSDIGSRVSTGQQYALAGRRGDWTAVWYLGQKGWFHNPREAPNAEPAGGFVVTPRPGKRDVPVYGRAYPEPEAYPEGVRPEKIVPLQYRMPAGQRYSVGLRPETEYFSATTFDPSNHVMVRGKMRYLQVQFGHRIAYVNTQDVRVLPAAAP